MSPEDVKADDRALVRVTITSGPKASFDYSTEQPDLVQVLKCATEQHSEMKGLDLPTIRSWRVTTALIVLEPGAEITFKTSWETRRWRSFRQWLRRRKAALEHRERTTTYRYDGRAVVVNEHSTCSSRPH
jgi:hypothetical protein